MPGDPNPSQFASWGDGIVQMQSSSESLIPDSKAIEQYWPHVVELCDVAGRLISVTIKVQLAEQNCLPSGPQVPAGGFGERCFGGG